LSLAVLLACAARAEPGPRVHENFDKGWLFERQSIGSGELGSFDRDTSAAARIEPRFQNATQVSYDDSTWRRITLPHTWNAYDVMDEWPGYWRGIGWYRKHFKLDPAWRGKRIFLEFEGVNSVSEFWLNGRKAGEHKGGYTGFEFEITPLAQFGGQENVLTVKVDNLYHDTVPPTVKTDYNFYGGLYRDVWLRVTDPVSISTVEWVTPSVSTEKAALRIRTLVSNQTDASRRVVVMHEILDPDGRVADTFSESLDAPPRGTLTSEAGPRNIAGPRLWSPDAPNLYTVRTTLRDGARVLDVMETPLGFRWFRFDPQSGFFLNGKRVQIQGTNWHQSYPGMGNALPNSRHWKDMSLIREMGANFWRTSHYPHDPATIDASDRLGLMVWEELPVNKELGNADEYIANVAQMAREMIARDRNHPSVLLWGIAGEINAPLDISKRVVESVAKLYRQLDPSRPVVMHAPRGEEIAALVDVVGEDVGKEVDDEHRTHPERSFMVGEYAAALIGRGIHDGGPNSEEAACEHHEKHLAEIKRRPWVAGGCIWHEFDYDGETYDVVTPHVTAFGMADIWRIPKDVYYFYQSQWSPKPMVHIAGHWTWPGQEGRARTVKVYSNAQSVELFLNGQALGAAEGDGVEGLDHPARVWHVNYQPGVLRAVAHADGKEVVDEGKTAGAAAKIVLDIDASKLISGDPESRAYITASITDEHGTVVPDASQAITFTLYGPGELLPQTWLGHGTGLTWNVVAGLTRIALRSTDRSGRAVISAYSPGLRMGRIHVDISAPGKPNEMDYKEFGTGIGEK
jgi:beta-galactosidase